MTQIQDLMRRLDFGLKLALRHIPDRYTLKSHNYNTTIDFTYCFPGTEVVITDDLLLQFFPHPAQEGLLQKQGGDVLPHIVHHGGRGQGDHVFLNAPGDVVVVSLWQNEMQTKLTNFVNNTLLNRIYIDINILYQNTCRLVNVFFLNTRHAPYQF